MGNTDRQTDRQTDRHTHTHPRARSHPHARVRKHMVKNLKVLPIIVSDNTRLKDTP